MEPETVGGNEDLHQALALEELIRANNTSASVMQRLVNHVEKETDARNRKVDALERNGHQLRRLMVLNLVAVALMIAFGAINAVNIGVARRQQAQASALARQVAATNSLLLDCLNSTGHCGQVNQANQKRILDEVKRYELTVIYCARTNPQQIDKDGTAFFMCIHRLYPTGPALAGR